MAIFQIHTFLERCKIAQHKNYDLQLTVYI